MNDFFKRYSYDSVCLFLNQLAIGLFGAMLALAAGMAENTALRTVTSVFAIIFFLFLQFSATWKVGAEDRVAIDLGKRRRDLSVPIKMWLLANSLNLLLALLMSLSIWTDVPALDSIGGFVTWIKLILEGMYTGVLAIRVNGIPLNAYWFMHFLTTVPSLVAIYASYLCGLNNISFGGLFSPNPTSKKK
ncbi:MAG: hypothetical protein IJY39_10345 [Clostridia bacterium]|nr:hypothetical protein [Clostridia bacterium]